MKKIISSVKYEKFKKIENLNAGLNYSGKKCGVFENFWQKKKCNDSRTYTSFVKKMVRER